jgi:hypothetical protein
MESTVKLSQSEACAAVRAYLILRGVLPQHGEVSLVGPQDGSTSRYGASSGDDVYARCTIADAPVASPPNGTSTLAPAAT